MSKKKSLAESLGAHETNRRTVLKAAAWSAPVIAIAVATPLAAASVNRSTISVASGSNMALSGGNVAGSVVTGSFGGSANITNAGTSWNVDSVYVEYQLNGPLTGAFFLFNGVPITGSTIVDGAYTWGVETNVEGYLTIFLVSPLPVVIPANGSTTVTMPTITYRDTLTNSAQWLPVGRRVVAQTSVVVTSTNGSIDDGNVKNFPASA